MRQLVEKGFAHNIKSAKRIVERVRPEVWDVLEEVIRDHPVLLNRAPTLHRLGIQAFIPVLVEGSAIQIHPLVCFAFNADFDGDQMAVHVPLSTAAQKEARELMLSTQNLLSAADGSPVVSPTHDMVLGCYYLTIEDEKAAGAGKIFSSFDEARMALDAGIIHLQAPIDVDHGGERVKTTVGRLILNSALPAELGFVNQVMDRKGLKELIARCYRDLGPAATATLVDGIKTIGFHYATVAGITIGIDDIKVPKEKVALLADADKKVSDIEREFRRGFITEDERYTQTVEVWRDTTDDVTGQDARRPRPQGLGVDDHPLRSARKRDPGPPAGRHARPHGRPVGPDHRPAHSLQPARGDERARVLHLEPRRPQGPGRHRAPDGGLGLPDPPPGGRGPGRHHPRGRLRDGHRDVDHPRGVDRHPRAVRGSPDRPDGGPRRDRPHHRRRSSSPATRRSTRPRWPRSNLSRALERVNVRSPLTCAARHGVCRMCYGRNLASGNLVDLGQAVGIIAAQSIGEPGTQLTMRTFHTGGVAGEDITQGLPRVEELFEARIPKGQAIVSEIDGRVEVQRGGPDQPIIVVVERREAFDTPIKVSAKYEILVEDGDEVIDDQLIARLEDGEETHEVRTPTAGVVARKARNLTIRSEEVDRREYQVPHSARLRADTGDEVIAGQPLTEGALNPKDLLSIKGVDAVQRFLVTEVQRVYRSQGVSINDKHVEIIVRQMLRKVMVDSAGDTELLPSEMLDRFEFEETNNRILAEGGEPATAQTILLGVTKASLNTSSFLAAASFQETTRVLTEAAIQGAKDHLIGLKENVIIGKLIPAGTGALARAEASKAKELSPEEVEALREREAAMTFLTGDADADGDGVIEPAEAEKRRRGGGGDRGRAHGRGRRSGHRGRRRGRGLRGPHRGARGRRRKQVRLIREPMGEPRAS